MSTDAEAKTEETKVPTPAPDTKPSTSTAEVKLDDFIILGRYVFIICILGEFLILNQLGNVSLGSRAVTVFLDVLHDVCWS